VTIPYAALFVTAGKRHGIDPALLAAMAKQESNFNPRAISPAGALGLMQLMPSTASHLNVDPFVPSQAVDAAARLMKQNLERFKGSVSLSLAAYNSGPGTVIKYGGIPPIAETQNYVRNVLAYQRQYAGTFGTSTNWPLILTAVVAAGTVGTAIFYYQKGRFPFMRR
jgi:soluble lytic murein transglycosylase-like protein